MSADQTVPNLFGYDGGLQAPGTSLIHYGARWYNPALGQWTQLDPTGQNPGYAYAGDNPVNYIDTTGQNLWALWDATLVGLAVWGVGLTAVLSFWRSFARGFDRSWHSGRLRRVRRRHAPWW